MVDATGESVADVAVIGAGAAGLGAALVLARARRRTVVFDDGPARNARAPHAYGFLGHDGIAGSTLLARGRGEIAGYGARIIEERAIAIDGRDGHGFVVRTASRSVAVRAIVLATGFVDLLPEIDGLEALWGTDAADCPYCHGWEARDRAIAVIGAPKKLLRMATLLTVWSNDVLLCSSSVASYGAEERARLAAAGVRVEPFDVQRLVSEDGRLRAVVLSNGERIARDAVFVGTKRLPASDLVRHLCEIDEAGFAVADEEGHTSRAGIWAVGNVADPIAKLLHSAAAGSRAATRVNEYLLDADLRAKISAAASASRS